MSTTDWRTGIRESKYGTMMVLIVTTLLVLAGAWIVSGSSFGESLLGKDDTPAGSGKVSQVDVDSAQPAPTVGEPAPAFTAVDVAGNEVSLEALHGKPVWLLFAATWCQGCRAEMPDVQAVADARDDVEVVVAFVGEQDNTVSGYLSRAGYDFAAVADESNDLSRAYGVLGIPAHFLIDAEGNVANYRVGVLSEDSIEEFLSAAK
ncbi:TlpA family protein disulfide reductase [Trueperella bernardiae]|uniref:TlpA disulfide reductase family protein n=2 Tax=Trueperella TaxID=1069494 RepID=A0AAW6ZL43_9ACTO|nr:MULTISPECIES: TlpA disulfide reductase family protein [Trueperella]MDK8602173.1 TlpA disulfide reductase family protein [Trueperella bernardiae]PKZ88521.1 TlpA family protein disulfide reductase [Trueperella bernardiae]QOR46960.1 TlpA family protein disulfide reductase [Trueperella pecoris]WIM07235.1 TlpA disulfide reductase family protein [Trueperella bernardiae]